MKKTKCWINVPNQKDKLIENIYILAFVVFIVYKFLETTTWRITWPDNFFEIIKQILIALTVARVCIDNKYTLKLTLAIAGLVFVCLFAWKTNGYTEILYMLILIIGCKGINADKIIRIYFGVSLALLLITITASLTGVIENLVYYQGEDRVRMSLGIIYPTDFSAHVFFLTLCYVFLRRKSLFLLECFIPIVLGAVVYFVCDARLNTICLFTFGIGLFIQFLWRKKSNLKPGIILNVCKLINNLLIIVPVLCAGFMINLTMVFSSDRWWTAKLNEILNNRLCYGREGLDIYGISLWGQYIEMMGNGSNTETKPYYFFLDSSYVSCLLRYGLVILLVVLIIVVCISFKAKEHKNFVLVWIMAVIGIQCMVEQHLIEVAYNPFLWLVLAKFTEDREQTIKGEKK